MNLNEVRDAFEAARAAMKQHNHGFCTGLQGCCDYDVLSDKLIDVVGKALDECKLGGLNEMRDEIHEIAREKGWYGADGRNVGEALMLVVCEASEAMEELREYGPEKLRNFWRSDSGKPEGFPVEIADILIRCLDLCGYLNIDIEEAVRQKVAYNRTRPVRHGGKFA